MAHGWVTRMPDARRMALQAGGRKPAYVNGMMG